MLRWNEARFSRVFGDVAILSRLEKLGKGPRNFDNLVGVGFPSHQLDEVRAWYADTAKTPVERYAADKLALGFFEDEPLLRIFCNYFECTDWKLEGSPWFFSQQDYNRFFKVLIDPVEFHIAQLEAGAGEERWGTSFLKLPFDLGMEDAKRSLWREICKREFFWKPQTSYIHLRADQLFQYLKRTVNIEEFASDRFNYNWEQSFRARFQDSLHRFESVLERNVRGWQEKRKEKSSSGFHYGSFRSIRHGGEATLMRALEYLGLDRATATLNGLQRTFRRLSKQTHPDHGGTPEEFRRLSAYKEVVESWLQRD